MKLTHTLMLTMAVAGFLTLAIIPSCTKTKTTIQTQTDTVRDTTIQVDTVAPLGDTTWKHLRDSLWAYYPINGNLSDSTPNNHVLTLNGGAALTYDMWGNANYAIDLPGGSAYGQINDGENFTAPDFSVTFYMMPIAVSGEFFGKQDWATNDGAVWNVDVDPVNSPNVFKFNVTNNQSAVCTGPPGTATAASCNSNLLQPYSWYQIAVSFNQTTGLEKLYINGQLQGTNTINQTITCDVGQFILGNQWAGGSSAFTGRMSQLRIYTRALTDHEVAYLFQYHL
jgi:hypothetical protein